MAPMPSISDFNTSPGLSFSWNSGESGLPVVNRSPGYKVVTCDRKLIWVAMSLIMASVLADCLSSPLIQSFIQRLCGSPISSFVVIQGPIGANVSKPLRTLRVPERFLLKP